MAKRYLINIFLLIAVLCGFSSCEEDWIVSSNLHLIRMGKDGIQEFIITQADA